MIWKRPFLSRSTMPCRAEMKVSDPLFRGIGSWPGMPLDTMVTVAIDSGHIVMSFAAMAFHLVHLDGVDDLGEADHGATGGLLRASGFH